MLNQDPEPRPETIALAFLEVYLDDRASGRVFPLRHYLSLFPGHERIVAEEYLAAEKQPASEPGELSDSSEGTRAVPPSSLGPYALRSVIGEGGQGMVWLAEDTRLRRMVAVKVLRSSGPDAEAQIRRFRRETETASKLYHPCICVVHDAGITNGVPWFAMQYVEGETMAARLRVMRDHAGAAAVWPVGEIVLMCEKIARALHVAHEQGVIHRDLKPSNIMISTTGDPVILDFGLARDAASPVDFTKSGDVFGTPAYMAPEQLSGNHESVDRRADVWGLGVTLYECLTLRHPFAAPTREALYQAIVTSNPPNPRSINPAISSDLRVVLETAIEKDLRRRYQTASACADDLRAVLEGRPIAARRIGTIGRGARWARREPVKAGLAALAFVGFTMLAILAGYNFATRADLEAGRLASLEHRRDGLLSDGYAELGEGDAARAAEHFDSALSLAPDSVEAAAGLVLAYLQQRDAGHALETLDRYAGLLAGRSSAVVLRAQALDLRGSSAEAATLRRSIPPPRDSADFFLEGQRRLAEGHARKTAGFRQALDAFTTAIMLSRSPKAAYYEARAHAAGHARSVSAVEETVRALLQFWPHSAESHRQAGRAYLDLGRSDEAVSEIREALRLNPDGRDLPGLLARALARQGSFDAATAVLREAIGKHPDREYIHQTFGEILLESGRATEALAELDRAIALNPTTVAAHLERSRALWSLQRPDQAIAALESALSLQPDHFLALLNLGTALKVTGDRSGAVSAYQKAIALRPELDDPVSLGLVASALWDCGETEAAFATAKEMLARWPGDADSHHRMAMLFAKASRMDEAVVGFRHAVAIDPGRAEFHLDLAFALSAAGMKREAIPEIEAFLEKRAGTRDVMSLLGTCLAETGERDRGLEILRRAHEAAPDSLKIVEDYGRALYLAGDFGEGLALLRRAHETGSPDSGLMMGIMTVLERCDAAVALVPTAEAVRAGGQPPDDPKEVAELCEIASRKGWHAESAGWYHRMADRDPDFAKTMTDDQVICVALSSLSIGREAGSQAWSLIDLLLGRWRDSLAAGGDPDAADVRARARTLEDQPAIRQLTGPGGVTTFPAEERTRWAGLLGDLAKIASRPS